MKLFKLSILLTVFFIFSAFTTETEYRHKVSEVGEVSIIQVDRILNDSGDVVATEVHEMETLDPGNIWDKDSRSRDIFTAIQDNSPALVAPKGVGIEEIITYDHEVLPTGQIQVRRITRIYRDGKEIGKNYHRHVLAPGDSLEGQNEQVKASANAVWTPLVINEHKARRTR